MKCCKRSNLGSRVRETLFLCINKEYMSYNSEEMMTHYLKLFLKMDFFFPLTLLKKNIANTLLETGSAFKQA